MLDSDGTGAVHSATLLQALTPISTELQRAQLRVSTGRSAQDAVRAAQQYAQEGKDWCGYRHREVLDTASYSPGS